MNKLPIFIRKNNQKLFLYTATVLVAGKNLFAVNIASDDRQIDAVHSHLFTSVENAQVLINKIKTTGNVDFRKRCWTARCGVKRKHFVLPESVA